MYFLARWAKRLPVKEVAGVFGTTWDKVYRSVEWALGWGLSFRDVKDIKAIGVDEIQWHSGQNYSTVIWQIEVVALELPLAVSRRLPIYPDFNADDYVLPVSPGFDGPDIHSAGRLKPLPQSLNFLGIQF